MYSNSCSSQNFEMLQLDKSLNGKNDTINLYLKKVKYNYPCHFKGCDQLEMWKS